MNARKLWTLVSVLLAGLGVLTVVVQHLTLSTLRLIATVEIGAGLACVLAFFGPYALRSGWWRTEIGRNNLVLTGALAVLLARSLIGRIFGPLGDAVWVEAFAVLDAAFLWRAAIVRRTQRRTSPMDQAELVAAQVQEIERLRAELGRRPGQPLDP